MLMCACAAATAVSLLAVPGVLRCSPVFSVRGVSGRVSGVLRYGRVEMFGCFEENVLQRSDACRGVCTRQPVPAPRVRFAPSPTGKIISTNNYI